MTRIALIHATPAAVDPIGRAFAEAWPDLVNLLDDSLSRDRALAPELSDGMFWCFDALGSESSACCCRWRVSVQRIDFSLRSPPAWRYNDRKIGRVGRKSRRRRFHRRRQLIIQ
jgi:hypothetical protein